MPTPLAAPPRAHDHDDDKSKIIWSLSPSPASENDVASAPPVGALAFSPDGSQLLAAIGTKLLLYKTTGEQQLLATLKAHKDAVVTAVDWSWDGARFASGAADGKVIIWTAKGEGLLKYGHQTGSGGDGDGGGVRQVTHNPVTHQLCSVAGQEFALWAPNQKAVVKKKVPYVIACVAWRADGQCLAVGYLHGFISLRDVGADGGMVEKATISRVEDAPLLNLAWVGEAIDTDVLAVVGGGGGKEQQRLSFYSAASQSKQEDLTLSFDVLALQPLPPLLQQSFSHSQSPLLLLLAGRQGQLYGVNIHNDTTKRQLVQILPQASNNNLLNSFAVSPAAADHILALGFANGTLTLQHYPDSLPSPPSLPVPPPPAPTQQQQKQQQQEQNKEAIWQASVEAHVTKGDLKQAFTMLSTYDPPLATSTWWEAQVLAVARAAQDPALVHDCGRLLAEAPSADNTTNTTTTTTTTRDNAVREIFLGKLQDISSLMAYYTRHAKWPQAVKLAKDKPRQFDPATFLPYAVWRLTGPSALVTQEFNAALSIFYQYDCAAQAKPLLRELVRNAVIEKRFQDASYYFWVLAVDAFHAGVSEKDVEEYHRLSTLADLYWAFQHIYAYTQEPFTTLSPLTLFQVSRFLLNSLGMGEAPFGISKVAIFYTLAKQAKLLGAFSLARSAYTQLLTLNVALSWRDGIEVELMHLMAKLNKKQPGQQEEEDPELQSVCYRCGHVNPHLNPASRQAKESVIVVGGGRGKNNKGQGRRRKKKGGEGCAGDVCVACGHPFVRSMVRFEVLPLVEFVPDPAMSEEEALALLCLEEEVKEAEGKEEAKGTRRSYTGKRASDVQFPPPPGGGGYTPLVVDAATLRALRREEVFVCQTTPSTGAHAIAAAAATTTTTTTATARERGGEEEAKREEEEKRPPPPPPTRMPHKYYRNVLHPDIPIALSQPARRFFAEEDFEMAYLKEASSLSSSCLWGGAGGSDAGGGGGEEKGGEQGEELVPACPFSRVKNVGDYGAL